MASRVLPVVSIASAVVAVTLLGLRLSNDASVPAPVVNEAAPTNPAALPPPLPSASEPPTAVQSEPPPASAVDEARPLESVPAEPAPVEPLPQSAPDAPLTAVNEVLPTASRRALQTIRGTIRVSVRVTVDNSGAVVRATLVDAGPSQYFARSAVEAAKQWTFTPSESAAPRTAVLRFGFTRDGATARPSN